MNKNLMKFSDNFQKKEFYNSGYANDHFFIPKSFQIKEYIKCSECGEVAGPVQTENFAKAYWAWNQGYQCCAGHWTDYLLKKGETIKVIEARAYSKNFIKAVNHPNNFNASAKNKIIYSCSFVMLLTALTWYIINLLGLSQSNPLIEIGAFAIPLTFYTLMWRLYYPEKVLDDAAINFNLTREDNYSIFEKERFTDDSITSALYNYVPNIYKYYFPMKNHENNGIVNELNKLNEAIASNNHSEYRKIIENWGEVHFISPMNGCDVDHGLFTVDDLKNNSIILKDETMLTDKKAGEIAKANDRIKTFTVNKYSTYHLFTDNLSSELISSLEEFERLVQFFDEKNLSKEQFDDLFSIIEEYQNNSHIVVELLENGVHEDDLTDYKELVNNYIKILKKLQETPLKRGLEELKISKTFINDKYWSALND